MAKEYIERERLINHFQNCIAEVKNTNGCTNDFEICLRAVQNQPTADVQEIRHGEWIKSKGSDSRECSLCGKTYFSKTINLNYCSDCGAKMNKGE